MRVAVPTGLIGRFRFGCRRASRILSFDFDLCSIHSIHSILPFDNICLEGFHTSAAVCLDARAAGTVLISTTNLVTLPAPPSCYCVCRLQPPPLCSACSAFAAAVALLVLCLSIVCVTVCLLLSVRVCLREPLHVCMSEIVYQGVSFALLLSAPRVASSRHRRCCLQFQSCRRLRKEAARCVVRQNSLSNSFQVAAHQCPHQPSIRCNRRHRAFRKLTEL